MISLICEKYGIENYTINPDGTIDVDGNVDLLSKGLTELPLRFNKVSGDFCCHDNKLTTLKGSPRWVGKNFYCDKNELTDLKFCPKNISGVFFCYNNRLTSLEYSPDYVGSDFDCCDNQLTDNFCETEIRGDFYTNKKQEGLVITGYKVENYKEWQKLIKRKIILNKII
jgi:hypothetical protein